jgi:hypothetical protein
MSRREAFDVKWHGRKILGVEATEEGTPILDTTPVTTAITRLISTGTTEEAVLAAVARRFPELS